MTRTGDNRVRTASRSISAGLGNLELLVSAGFGKTGKGEIVELSSAGVNARFSHDQSLVLAIGEIQQLAFRWCDQEFESLDIEAQVRARYDAEHSVRYEFSFQELPGPSHEALSRLFNRRGAYRARTEPGVVVDVQLWVHQQVPRKSLISARLKDISVLGMGLTAQVGQDDFLKSHSLVDISFKLPGMLKQRAVSARIVKRELRGDSVHYGLQFSNSLAQALTSNQDEISAYIDRLEQEDSEE